jgi:sortase A
VIAAEVIAWTLGVFFVAVAAWRYIDGVSDSRQAMEDFARQRHQQQFTRAALLVNSQPPDLTLWSPQRIAAWQHASSTARPTPLAILRIPRIRLAVPVLEGTDDATLDRGLGHIDQTAIPGAEGNSGIAGHRDGFFRGLKDVATGDDIELETLNGKEIYRIERIWLVMPEDVSVLDPTPTRTLTLVTCYPFYFVGSAPQRYIVRAIRTERS